MEKKQITGSPLWAIFALDLNMVEAMRQLKALDLAALRRGCAICNQRQLDPELLQPVEGFVSARKHPQFGVVQCVEVVGDDVAQGLLGRGGPPVCGQFGEGCFDDVPTSLPDLMTPMLVPRLVFPEISGISLDRGDNARRLVRVKALDIFGDNPLPLALGLTKGRDDRVVEVDQDRARQIWHGLCHA